MGLPHGGDIIPAKLPQDSAILRLLLPDRRKGGATPASQAQGHPDTATRVRDADIEAHGAARRSAQECAVNGVRSTRPTHA